MFLRKLHELTTHVKMLYKSLYPNTMLEFNIAPNTQIGKIVIPEKIYEFENVYKIPEERYSRGGEFVDNLVTDNTIEFSKRWFHLASIEEFIQDIDEYYQNKNFGKFGNCIDTGNWTEQPLKPYKIESPIYFDINKKECPIIFYNKKPEIRKEKIK